METDQLLKLASQKDIAGFRHAFNGLLRQKIAASHDDQIKDIMTVGQSSQGDTGDGGE